MKKILMLLTLTLFIGICSCNRFGSEIKYGDLQIFYEKSVSRNDATRLGDYLVKSGFTSEGNERKTVQLKEVDGKYQFRMVVKKDIENDPEYIKLFHRMASELSRDVFNNSPVEIHACNATLTTLKVFQMEALEDWEKYAGLKYEIKYPSTWTVQEAPSDYFSISLSPRLAEYNPYKMLIGLTIEDLSNNPVTIEEYTQLGLNQLKNANYMQNFKIVETNYQNDGVLEKAKIVYTATMKDEDFRIEQYYSINHNSAYILTFSIKANADRADLLKEAHDILNTFTYTGK